MFINRQMNENNVSSCKGITDREYDDEKIGRKRVEMGTRDAG